MPQLKQVVERIKKAKDSRITSQPGTQSVMIEILTEAGWVAAIKGLNRNMAEDVIRQAKDRMILG